MEPWQILDGTYSPRLLLAWIMALPPGCATVAAIQGGEQFRGWDTHSYMLANLVDAVQDNTYAFIKAHAKRPPKRPQPIERPKKKRQPNKDPNSNKFMSMARIAYKAGQKKQEGR